MSSATTCSAPARTQTIVVCARFASIVMFGAALNPGISNGYECLASARSTHRRVLSDIYQCAEVSVDISEYRTKYCRYAASVIDSINSQQVRSTTTRLVPR